MKKTLTLLILILSINISYSQYISINSGMYSYNGDLKKSDKIKSGTNWQFGYGASIGKTFKNGIAIEIGFNKYALAQNEVKVDSNLNFKTSILEFSGNFLYHLDNDIFINKTSRISPYLGFGVGFINYETNYDLKDNAGEEYHYWKDGSIRNQEEEYENIFTSEKIRRDYDYETSANNSAGSIVIPLIIGAELKTGNKISFGIALKYFLASTDLLDNYKIGGNDSYLNIGASLKYNIKAKSMNKLKNMDYKGMKFSEIDKMDQDKDGVIDTKDLCQSTKPGEKVDDNGCPFDLDKDYVYDYKDKEPNTLDSAAVTVEGITISDEHFQIMQMLYDGQIFPVEDFFYENFPYIPVLLRNEMAEQIEVDREEKRFVNSSEELKNVVKTITVIGTSGEITVFKSTGSEKK
ncbi:MAG: hypothetical protein COB15_11415 [Flavobacteriales bacterium]|nr:MAG: hypothetical protein COB15_11415 [Flavobacteriales bacterium]